MKNLIAFLFFVFACAVCTESSAQSQQLNNNQVPVTTLQQQENVKPVTHIMMVNPVSSNTVVEGRLVETDSQGIQNLAVPQQQSKTEAPIIKESNPE